MIFFGAICIALSSKFSPQNSANLIWYRITLGTQHDFLLEAIVTEAVHELALFSTQDASNMVWEFTTLGVRRMLAMTWIARNETEKMRDFRPQDFGNGE